jgi:CubicO group peptidase (beta-lactamase class C family)
VKENSAAASGMVSVSGFASGRFEPIADIFARTLADQGDGAALCVYLDGQPVVDLVGGGYRPDSLQLLFSVSKSVTGIASALAAERGQIDLDAPLSEFWPAFAKRSTASVTTRMVLSHRSGLAAIDRELSFAELLAGADEAELERQEPYWEPGTRHGYHAFTFGTLMNGIFRRAVGRSVGQFVADELSGPLDLELWIGTPREQWPRIQPISYAPSAVTPGRAAHLAASRIPAGSSGQLARTMDLYNADEVYAADWPSTSGVGSARTLAALFAATLEDGTVLSAAARRRMLQTEARGHDEVLGIPMHYGSGVQLPFPQLPLLGPRSFGHEAAGGSAVLADEEFGIAVGYTTSRFPAMAGASSGFLTLSAAIRHCLTADLSRG